MELTFLGTSAGVPTRTRNMTSIILNLQQPTRAEMWLFDCGEGTQHQFLHTPHHPGKLNKIFITHLHGVGPGLVFDEEGYRVTAFPLSHPVECYGYRIEQHDKPGALDAAQLIADGVPPGPLFHRLKRGEQVTLADGRVIDGSRYLGPATPGKTLAIFGDTAPCPQALEMARGADVMVHETTLEQAMAEKANSRGHSSSQQTATLAKEAGVGTLIATHFSSRYDAEGCLRMLAECREIFPDTLLAEDFMVYTVA